MPVTLIAHKPDRIIGLAIDGWIDGEDIDRVVKQIEPRLDTGEKLSVYAEVNSWSGMSLEAFIKDLKFSLKHVKDFEREAIVSDRQWLKALAALGNTLFSAIEVKHFTPDEKDKALEWLGVKRLINS
ncbi:MAG: STAS/SEC14 domain-containing protein [Cyanobacteria bacterium P01_G01_bin.19]